MEKVRSRNVWALVGISIGAAALSSCSMPNYSGEGNEFVLKGEIENVGEQSVTVEVLEEIEALGWAADGWFDPGDSRRIHDNCDCHGFWRGRKQYGEVYDEAGQQIAITDLEVGECLLITGWIRTDSDGKYSHERAVFDSAQIIDCY